MDIALIVLRVAVGLLFVGHGSQKLFGWFGGGGRAGTAGFFASLGLQPTGPLAVMAGLAELTGGLLLVLGLLTPLATLFIAAVMFTAIISVHWPKIWNSEGGLEYPLVNVAAVFAVSAAGPGAWSLDRLLGLPEAWGPLWALGAVALALVSSAIVVRTASRVEGRMVRQARSEASAADQNSEISVEVDSAGRERDKDRLAA